MDIHEEWDTVQALLEQQEYSSCIVLLEQLLYHTPQDPIYLYWLAYCFIQIGHPIAAIETLEQYCDCCPTKIDLPIQSALLIAHFDATHFQKAEEFAKEGVRVHPNESIFHRYMGLLASRRCWTEAEPFFEKASQLDPKQNPLPAPPQKPSIFDTVVSWLPTNAREWIQSLDVQFEDSPTIEILNQEEFPHHPLVPFLLYNNTMYVFLNNLRYQPQHKSTSAALFEQLLELWNDYESTANS